MASPGMSPRSPPAAPRPANACGLSSASPRRPPTAPVSSGTPPADRPQTLAAELKTILPELEKPLGQGGAGRFRLEVPKP